MILLSTISFLATLVYQYDWTSYDPYRHEYYTPVPGGSEDTGSIQFLDPCGTGGLEQVYDLTFTSRPSQPLGFDSNYNVVRDEVAFPVIASRTFHLADVPDLNEEHPWDGFQGQFSWDGSLLGGQWSLGFFTPLVQLYAGSSNIQDFFPIKYYDNEEERFGRWKFVGVKSVPEAGSTLALLAFGSLIVVALRNKYAKLSFSDHRAKGR